RSVSGRAASVRADRNPRKSESRASSARIPAPGRRSNTWATLGRRSFAATPTRLRREDSSQTSSSGGGRPRESGGNQLTIPYRIDSPIGFTDDVALHKIRRRKARRSIESRIAADSTYRYSRANVMTAAMPAVLDYPFAAPPVPGEVVEVAPRILWLRMPLPFALDHINLWLLEENDGATLVDCGYGNEATRAIWERHFATTLSRHGLKRIIATHCHPDHVGNAAWLATRFAVPVTMTHAEVLTAHAIFGERAGHGVASTVDLFRRHGMANDHLAALTGRGNAYRRGVPDLPESFDRLLDGDERQAGDTTWRIVEGHGHSPEHASLFSAERGVLISGDMLLPKISTNVSVTPIERDGDPLALFLESLAVIERLPADTLV